MLAALLLLLAIVILGLTATPKPVDTVGPLRRETLTAPHALVILQEYLSGAGCADYLRQAQVRLDHQYAQVTLPAFGVFEVQSHHLGLFTVRPLTPIAENEGCQFDPRYRGPAT